jgi:DNA excision repair protein ERCC-3
MDNTKPLIIQSDRTILLDCDCAAAEEGRTAIMPFAELEKSPEHIHTYKISPLSLWNAASAGFSSAEVVEKLTKYSRYDIPAAIPALIADIMSRWGKVKLTLAPENGAATSDLFISIRENAVYAEIAASKVANKCLTPENGGFRVKLEDRGTVKWELIKIGYPVEDLVPLQNGESLDIDLSAESVLTGLPWSLRGYQEEAARAIAGDGGPGTGYGVVALPCGSGKTIVGMALMALLKTNTLILTANTAAVHQWIEEIIDKTTLKRENVAEYTGHSKNTAPVTIATYQILTWRPSKVGPFPHFELFRARNWGLIIYDEVHLLPAAVFRITAEIQAVRRLGLTATLVREDGEANAVFSLVGPKRYDVPWKDLENAGWIAEAFCHEIRLDLPDGLKIEYASAEKREKYRIASENPAKESAVVQLIDNHPEDNILVIGQYLSQLEKIARVLDAPLITGKTPNAAREAIYDDFRKGKLHVIVVSKVANFAIDLPDASMAIQISGSFGSRQEEAQRLGRILRPKARPSYFYTLVSHYTVEEDFAMRRHQFLAEQGYRYTVQHWENQL